MTDKLTLYNNALLILGERKLSSATEDREARRKLDTVWDRPAIDACLELGLWQFATRSQEITESPSVTPAFGYTYAFDRPDDFVRTVALSGDEFFTQPLLDYQTEGAYWYASVTPIYLRYVSNDNAFGYDFSLWPSNFTRMVEAYLAKEVVTGLTQDKAEWQRVFAVFKDALTTAQATDAMEKPTMFPPQGSWVRSRTGNRRGDRGKRNTLTG